MRISQKSEYALRAMLDLAFAFKDPQSRRSADIARNQHIPEKFLELILVELRRAGLILSQRGPVGGHRLVRSPEEISVGAIWRAIDGGLAAHVSKTNGREDPFLGVWKEVDRAIAKVVDHISLADMCERSQNRKSTPDYNI